MWKTSAAATATLLEAWVHICRECSAVLPETRGKTVTMPVEDGFVTVEIDEQEIELLLDTGYYSMSVMDGRWYERKYGREACDGWGSGCYFCPKKAPCKFNNAKGMTTQRFEDLSTIDSIPRSGSMKFDGHKPTHVTFLVSRYTKWEKPFLPHGHFGISRFPTQYESQVSGCESFIDNLVRENVIGRKKRYTELLQAADRAKGIEIVMKKKQISHDT